MHEDSQFNFQPTLVSQSVALRPLLATDFERVYAAASDPLIWEQHQDPSRYQRQIFKNGFFAGALASGSAFVVTDKASGEVIGSTRYYEWNPTLKEVAIGFTFLARSHWGGNTNQEMKRLMLDHAFRWAKVVWFHVSSGNRRSRRAVEKIGGYLDHQESKMIQGVEQSRVFYRIDAP